MKHLVLCLFFFIIPLKALAFEKGETVSLGLVCKGPDIVKTITTTAESSVEDASKTIYAAEAVGMCSMGRFQATLEEKTGGGCWSGRLHIRTLDNLKQWAYSLHLHSNPTEHLIW